MSDQIVAKFNCAKCRERITWDDEMPDNGIVTCPGCGVEVGPLSELKQLGIDRAVEAALDIAKGKT